MKVFMPLYIVALVILQPAASQAKWYESHEQWHWVGPPASEYWGSGPAPEVHLGPPLCFRSVPAHRSAAGHWYPRHSEQAPCRS